jgi:hypothetical protein
MWLWLLACERPFPEAFDWRIDRTLVPGIRVSPEDAPEGVARVVDALVLSPYAVLSTSVEICGLRTDVPSSIDHECYSDPDLIQEVATGEFPLALALPELGYACGGQDVDLCTSEIPLRVVAETAEDAGFGSILVEISVLDIPFATPDPVPVVVDHSQGDPVAGGEILLRTLVFASTVTWDPPVMRWYVDDGELLGTGRTQLIDQGGSFVTENTLRIPEGYSGPLRVAVVTPDGRYWGTTTVEVP